VVGILKCDVGQIIAGGPKQWFGLVGISGLSQEPAVVLKKDSKIIKLPQSRPILMVSNLKDTTPLAIESGTSEAGDTTCRWTNMMLHVSHPTLQPVDKFSDKINKYNRQLTLFHPHYNQKINVLICG
jgi:hypothetical protein